LLKNALHSAFIIEHPANKSSGSGKQRWRYWYRIAVLPKAAAYDVIPLK